MEFDSKRDIYFGHMELRVMVREAQVALEAVNPENPLLSLFTITDRGEYWDWSSFKEYTKGLSQDLRFDELMLLYIDDLNGEAGRISLN
ncbi:MAG TPA: hypothetical protein HA282_01420 [Nanoarchaeota archaeon]|nr:MAG: hypothetical protein QT01_C0003G0027 [archaeon GW2011_AR6]MBS3082955.1 hypothetical protein [Candidatus Pacearchaeota archaeon]HIH18339.1 hypothetical protein [Nanoarchaeota archaeon]HIH34773.1 hypothetical protein [Nanoarchaeota archaeon]HIH51205.1 hypothetical protein [Nanoarchaeota archaeon]